MPSVKVNTADFNISSAWKCKEVMKYHGTQNYGWKEWVFANGPSENSHDVVFSFSLPSGSKATKVQVWAKITKGSTGASTLTANGNPFNINGNGEVGANVTLTGNVDLKVTFKFKANGSKNKDTNMHYSTTQFKDVYLLIEYEGTVVESTPTLPVDESQNFHVPPQSVAVYNQENGTLYLFDGVAKIQHTFSVKIEEEPEKHKDEFVNNARNQPDKLVLDVLMSDVYSDDDSLTIASGWDESIQETAYNSAKERLINTSSRSGNAVAVLRKLKEARTKLSVITPQYVHVDMILATITINQDDTCPFGWQGQIEFQHTFKAEEKKKNNNSRKTTGKTPPPSSPNGVNIWGSSSKKIDSIKKGRRAGR